jgi:hypothetical protein
MKQNVVTIISATAVITALTLVPFVYGKTASPSATPTSSDLQGKIDNLKERLATKVAELRKTSPKAIFGTVSSVTISSITIDTTTKSMKIDLTDNIQVFQILKGKRTKLTTDDISKGDPVTIFGDYDSTLDVLQAKTIFIEASKQPQRIHGFVTDIDKKNNAFSLKSLDGSTYSVDIETTTKTLIWTPADGITKSGFSKIETGMFVSVLGLADPKTPNSFSGVRVLHMNPRPGATPTITPTATPAKVASPSATPTKQPAIKTKPTVSPAP